MASVPLLPLLPEVFQVCAPSSAPLRAIAAVAGDMQAPVQEVLDSLDRVVDPFRTPEALLGYLSRWVDLGWLTLPEPGSVTGAAMGIEPARQRDLIANAADLSARRGTPSGLLRFLQLATGQEGFGIDVDPEAFHLRVRVPSTASDQIEIIRRIVGGVKPAHVTAEVLETGQIQDGSSMEAAGPEESRGGAEKVPGRPSTPPRSASGGQVNDP